LSLFAAVFSSFGCDPPPVQYNPPGSQAQDASSADDLAGSADLASPIGTMDSGAHDLARLPSSDLASSDLAQPTTQKVLPFVWEGEVLDYMCGPSATRMALSTRMSNPPSQQELATYLGTTTAGTNSIGLVRGALNHYLNITSYNETDLPTAPTAAEQAALKHQLVQSIDAGYALVANVVSGFRPPSYPPKPNPFYHYIALVGYDANGDKVMVADPAGNGCGDGHCGDPSSPWYNTLKSYWINTSDLGVWIVPKGYSWHP
jgi:hypothetical protein